jgi:hypothetical protein
LPPVLLILVANLPSVSLTMISWSSCGRVGHSFVPPAVRPVAEAEPSKMEADLQKASFVYVRRGAPSSALSPLYQGHYKVLTRWDKVFHRDVGGRKEVISADRLKPHTGTSTVQPADPPRRGRPPTSGRPP